MTCKDCIHYECCDDYYHFRLKEPENVENKCSFYKDKSLFVELPCKVGDKVWYIYNGRIYFQFASKKNIYSIATRGKVGHSIFLTKEAAEKALNEC